MHQKIVTLAPLSQNHLNFLIFPSEAFTLHPLFCEYNKLCGKNYFKNILIM